MMYTLKQRSMRNTVLDNPSASILVHQRKIRIEILTSSLAESDFCEL